VSERPFWATILQWTLWGVVMSLVMGWLGKSRFRVRPTSDARRLYNPPSTLIVGALCFLLFAGLAVVSNVVPNKTSTWWTTLIFAGFAMLSLPIVVSYFAADYRVSEDGLDYRTFFGTKKYLRWSELGDVRYATGMKWFRLETHSGVLARVSVMLMGLPEFARLLLEHTPHDVIESGALLILQETAKGNPPSVWN
jgi:hypothetical protein